MNKQAGAPRKNVMSNPYPATESRRNIPRKETLFILLLDGFDEFAPQVQGACKDIRTIGMTCREVADDAGQPHQPVLRLSELNPTFPAARLFIPDSRLTETRLLTEPAIYELLIGLLAHDGHLFATPAVAQALRRVGIPHYSQLNRFTILTRRAGLPWRIPALATPPRRTHRGIHRVPVPTLQR